MRRRKLLLADDSVTIQKVVNLTFADEGIDVETVGNGDDAIDRIHAEVPDIVLADVNMPGLSGYQICELLKQNNSTAEVPVVLLVGTFEPFDEDEARRVGADGHLTKPFQSIRQLVAQVTSLIDVRQGVDATDDGAAIVNGEISPTVDRSDGPFEHLQDNESIQVRSGDDEPADVGEDEEIDSLYERSLSLQPESELSDVGLDDEIIETSYGNRERETEEFLGLDVDDHAPISTSDPAATDSETLQPAVSFQSSEGADLRDPSLFERTMEFRNWQPADMRGDAEPVEEQPESEADASAAFENERSSDHAQLGEETVRMERPPMMASAGDSFSEVDLLDLSNPGGGTVELTASAATPQAGVPTLVTISDELVERIAQRVIEKLSEKY